MRTLYAKLKAGIAVLGWKTAIWVVLPVVCGALASMFIMAMVMKQDTRQFLGQLMAQEMVSLDRELAFLEAEMERLATNPVLINAMADIRLRQETLPELMAGFAYRLHVKSFVLTDPVGSAVFTHMNPMPDDQELPNLKEAVATGKVASYLNPSQGMYVVAAPIHYYKSLQGVIVAGFDLEAVVRRSLVAGGGVKLTVEKRAWSLGGDEGTGVWQSRQATNQTPLLYRLGVHFSAGLGEGGASRIKVLGFLLFAGLGSGLMVWFVSAWVVGGIRTSMANSFDWSQRVGRFRGMAVPQVATKNGASAEEDGPSEAEVKVRQVGMDDLVRCRTRDLEKVDEGWRTVIDALPVRLFWKDRGGMYRGCNAEFARDAGLASCKDVVDLRETDMPWQERVSQCQELEQTVWAEARPSLYRAESIRLASGENMNAIVSRLPLKDDQGEVTGMVGVYWEVFEKREERMVTEQPRRLAEMEKWLWRFSSVVNQGTPLVLIANVKGEVGYVSPSFCTALGINPEDILGKPHELMNIGLVGEAGKPWQGELEVARKDGWTLRVLTMVAPIPNKEGRIEDYFSLSQDISAFKEMERDLTESRERLLSVLRFAEEGVWEWDLVRDWMIFSPRWLLMFGIEGVDPDPGKGRENRHQRVHPDEREIVEGAIQVHLSGVREFYMSEHRMRHEDGHWMTVLERGRITRWDEQGTPLRMVCGVVDRSDRVGEPGREMPTAALAAQPEPAAIVATEVIPEESQALGGEVPPVSVFVRPWPQVHGLDIVAGLGRVAGDIQLYRHLLAGFHEKYFDLTKRLQEMMVKSRYDRINRELQGVREVLFELGAFGLHDQVGALEGVLQCSPRKKTVIIDQFIPFCRTFDVLMEELRRWKDQEADFEGRRS
ncbi:MAG: PAS domain-containing protein [Magnetococcales bacterium]|nr:PAS domain-containing protein [Magnetococcales bacterium]